MTLIRNLFFLFTLTIFAMTSAILCIFNYNPYEANAYVLINFYTSLFASLAGMITIVIYYIKTKLSKNETIYRYFWPSVRQGVFISAGITAILFLRGMRIIDWLISISIIIVVVLLELFFQTKKGKVA